MLLQLERQICQMIVNDNEWRGRSSCIHFNNQFGVVTHGSIGPKVAACSLNLAMKRILPERNIAMSRNFRRNYDVVFSPTAIILLLEICPKKWNEMRMRNGIIGLIMRITLLKVKSDKARGCLPSEHIGGLLRLVGPSVLTFYDDGNIRRRRIHRWAYRRNPSYIGKVK